MNPIKLLIGFLLCVMLAFAIVDKLLAVDATKLSTPAELSKSFIQDTFIIGTIEKTGDALVIKTADGTAYIPIGQDLSQMERKKVKVTGFVSEETKGKTIKATAIEEIKS